MAQAALDLISNYVTWTNDLFSTTTTFLSTTSGLFQKTEWPPNISQLSLECSPCTCSVNAQDIDRPDFLFTVHAQTYSLRSSCIWQSLSWSNYRWQQPLGISTDGDNFHNITTYSFLWYILDIISPSSAWSHFQHRPLDYCCSSTWWQRDIFKKQRVLADDIVTML